MGSVVVLLRWGWLLSISLLAPISLPAGGAERNLPQIKQRNLAEPFLAEKSISLKALPLAVAPSLCRLKIGTPFRLVRYWEAEDGSRWIYVEIADGETKELINAGRRGWLNA